MVVAMDMVEVTAIPTDQQMATVPHPTVTAEAHTAVTSEAPATRWLI